MTKHFGWAKRPFIYRYFKLFIKIPNFNEDSMASTHRSQSLSFGEENLGWTPALPMKFRPDDRKLPTLMFRWNSEFWHLCQIIWTLKIVTRAGHHIYADAPEDFCRLLAQVSDMVDGDADLAVANDSSEWRDRVPEPPIAHASGVGGVSPNSWTNTFPLKHHHYAHFHLSNTILIHFHLHKLQF